MKYQLNIIPILCLRYTEIMLLNQRDIEGGSKPGVWNWEAQSQILALSKDFSYPLSSVSFTTFSILIFLAPFLSYLFLFTFTIPLFSLSRSV